MLLRRVLRGGSRKGLADVSIKERALRRYLLVGFKRKKGFSEWVLRKGVSRSCLGSEKEKAHRHKQFCPVTAWVRGGGSPDQVAKGQMFMCCVRNPRNLNICVG